MRPMILPFAALAAAMALAAPAAAQDAGGDKVNQLIIYGNDKCPESTGGEIVICAKKAEGERYRIPEMFRGAESPQNEAWTNKVLAYETMGKTGTMSCTPTGAGGWTGCQAKLINEAYKERAGAPDVRFGQLIEAERARRLATIDATSAEEQARVESLEKQYEARLKAQDAAADAAAPATDAPLPVPPRG